jgi:hypothetical protein
MLQNKESDAWLCANRSAHILKCTFIINDDEASAGSLLCARMHTYVYV